MLAAKHLLLALFLGVSVLCWFVSPASAKTEGFVKLSSNEDIETAEHLWDVQKKWFDVQKPCLKRMGESRSIDCKCEGLAEALLLWKSERDKALNEHPQWRGKNITYFNGNEARQMDLQFSTELSEQMLCVDKK